MEALEVSEMVLQGTGTTMDCAGASETLEKRDERPKILLVGRRKSGKSSIQRVVFAKMSPNDTLYIESTNKIEKHDVSDCSFIKFQIQEFPGHLNIFNKSVFVGSSAVIFIIDAQENCQEALLLLQEVMHKVFKTNRNIKLEVFIHKVDCLGDEHKVEIQREITNYVTGLLDVFQAQTLITGCSVGYHLTTIYDHSIFEAFSKVVQKLIPNLDYFENLLDVFINRSLLEKAFLLDVSSKIYLTTDSNPVDLQVYELCCDMIDVVMDISSIYTNPFSQKTESIISLNSGTVLYLRGVNQYLALAAVMREQALEHRGSIDYNFLMLRSGLEQMLEVNRQTITSTGNHEPDNLGDSVISVNCISNNVPDTFYPGNTIGPLQHTGFIDSTQVEADGDDIEDTSVVNQFF